MIETLLQAIMEQLKTPKADIEHNLRAVLSEMISKMDLVSQEELDRQKQALALANQRLVDLQQQVNTLIEQQKQN